MRINQQIINMEFIKFVGVGGVAALINFISRVFLNNIFNYATAIIIAYLIGMATAYSLCRLIVFTPKNNSNAQQMMLFIFVNVLAVSQTLAISLILYKHTFLWINDLSLRATSAHFVGVLFPVISSYFGHKYLTFK